MKNCVKGMKRFMKLLDKTNTRSLKQNAVNKVQLSRSKNNNSDWNIVMSEAEKTVGYPTSFLNLRWLLSDEIANVAFHLTKLMGTNHPLLQTAKDLFITNSAPSWGLIVLLVSKAGGLNQKFSEIEHDHTAGVLHSQRALAEVTEMLRTSNRIHKALLNFDTTAKNSADLNYGNKIALLSGDYLLSSSYHELACLKNQQLNELMSSALRDLTECEFIGECDQQNNPLPCRPQEVAVDMENLTKAEFGTDPINGEKALGNAKEEWTLRNTLGGASLLGKACQGALMLAGHSDSHQRKGYLLGKHLALSWQAYIEREMFISNSNKYRTFSLVSAPVLFHLQYEPQIYRIVEEAGESVENVDFEKLRQLIVSGPGMQKTMELQQENSKAALELLEYFEVEDAKNSLRNIIHSIGTNMY